MSARTVTTQAALDAARRWRDERPAHDRLASGRRGTARRRGARCDLVLPVDRGPEMTTYGARPEQLKCLGNGVVPQQAAAATAAWVADTLSERAA